MPITAAEARAQMGVLKKDQIRFICAGERVRAAWTSRHGQPPSEPTSSAFSASSCPGRRRSWRNTARRFRAFARPWKRGKSAGLRIGSTTGYTRALLDVVLPAAAKLGYSPDASVTPDEVGGGRPKPFMCYRNAILLGVFPLWHCVKIGDTPADIAEGLNAGMWTIALTATGNEIGLSRNDWEALPPEERATRTAERGQAADGCGRALYRPLAGRLHGDTGRD